MIGEIGQTGSPVDAGSGTNNISALSPTPTSPSTFKLTDGWYVFIACTGGIVLANTRFGPVAFGILSLALLYQTSLLLQGK